MNLAVAYARLAASPDFAEQTKLAALRAEHREQLADTRAKFVEEISTLRRELAAARRELNALRTHNEWYARKLKTYDGIAQLIAAAARTEPVR
jgi:chromosome segregation ATPase